MDGDMISLHEHFDMRIAALEKATEVAAKAMERRLDSMNEFREALREQAGRMATKNELDAAASGIEKELRQLREFKTSLEAKASQQQVNVALALSVLGLAVTIIRWATGG